VTPFTESPVTEPRTWLLGNGLVARHERPAGTLGH
jgi:hypothetical protein